MRDAVARAIYKACSLDMQGEMPLATFETWEEISDANRESFRRMADAAIAVLAKEKVRVGR